MNTNDSPFTAGSKVGVNSGLSHDGNYRSDEVLKVHKNGNFTLKSNPTQQYKPSSFKPFDSDEIAWTAAPTGTSYSRTVVRLWDARLEEMIAQANAERKRRHKLQAVKRLVASISERCDDDALIDALGAALREAYSRWGQLDRLPEEVKGGVS